MKCLSLLLIPLIAVNTDFAGRFVLPAKFNYLVCNEFRHTAINPELFKFNLSPVWLSTPNEFVYGFIGSKYQRIRIKFISVKKDAANPCVYHVYGKSMVKNNIADFTGSIKITKHLRLVDEKIMGVKNRYSINGIYNFVEDKALQHSGIFSGTFKTGFFIDTKGRVKYDDLDLNADGYTNNEFTGTWAHYNGKLVQQCNWGDYRIPNSGNFDIGAGEFSPNDKYLSAGWQTVRDMYLTDATGQLAKQQEENKWWK